MRAITMVSARPLPVWKGREDRCHIVLMPRLFSDLGEQPGHRRSEVDKYPNETAWGGQRYGLFERRQRLCFPLLRLKQERLKCENFDPTAGIVQAADALEERCDTRLRLLETRWSSERDQHLHPREFRTVEQRQLSGVA